MKRNVAQFATIPSIIRKELFSSLNSCEVIRIGLGRVLKPRGLLYLQTIPINQDWNPW